MQNMARIPQRCSSGSACKYMASRVCLVEALRSVPVVPMSDLSDLWLINDPSSAAFLQRVEGCLTHFLLEPWRKQRHLGPSWHRSSQVRTMFPATSRHQQIGEAKNVCHQMEIWKQLIDTELKSGAQLLSIEETERFSECLPLRPSAQDGGQLGGPVGLPQGTARQGQRRRNKNWREKSWRNKLEYVGVQFLQSSAIVRLCLALSQHVLFSLALSPLLFPTCSRGKADCERRRSALFTVFTRRPQLAREAPAESAELSRKALQGPLFSPAFCDSWLLAFLSFWKDSPVLGFFCLLLSTRTWRGKLGLDADTSKRQGSGGGGGEFRRCWADPAYDTPCPRCDPLKASESSDIA